GAATTAVPAKSPAASTASTSAVAPWENRQPGRTPWRGRGGRLSGQRGARRRPGWPPWTPPWPSWTTWPSCWPPPPRKALGSVNTSAGSGGGGGGRHQKRGGKKAVPRPEKVPGSGLSPEGLLGIALLSIWLNPFGLGFLLLREVNRRRASLSEEEQAAE